jgi:hypothetical protein
MNRDTGPAKFKVGDRVTITPFDAVSFEDEWGKVPVTPAVVTSVGPGMNSPYIYQVFWEDYPDSKWNDFEVWWEFQLEKV